MSEFFLNNVRDPRAQDLNFQELCEEINEEVEMSDVAETDNESDIKESEDDSLTDDENVDYEEVNYKDLKENKYDDCGGCGKILTLKNSYKCKKCGSASHRSICNTWFNTVKKHHYCSGCVYDFEPTKV